MTEASTDTLVPEPSTTPKSTAVTTLKPTTTPAPTVTHTVAITPVTDFNLVAEIFESKELGITVEHPLGWIAKQNLSSGTIAVVDDWEKFTKGNANAEAIGILILVLQDQGKAANILEGSVAKLKNLTERVGEVVVEEHDGQAFAWAEYKAKSLGDGTQVHYFLTVITTDKRSVLVFASVNTNRQESVRPIYHAIVERIKLH